MNLSESQLKAEIKAMREFTAELIKSPERCREFLYRTGMHTKSGKLKKKFR